MSATASGAEVVIGCVDGSIRRCTTSRDLLSHVVEVGHTAPITAICFDRTGHFVTGTAAGDLQSWDIADYGNISCARNPKFGAVNAIAFLEPEGNETVDQARIITGWEDGFIRCMDYATLSQVLWFVPGAHRGGVTTLASKISSKLNYMISGGQDGIVRIWRLSNRELVTQYADHRGRVRISL